MFAEPMRADSRPPSRALRVAGASLLALALLAAAWFLPMQGESAGIEPTDAHREAAPVVPVDTEPGATPLPRTQAEALEREAIAAHLLRVETALRGVPTDHLDEERRAARMALLDELGAYREAGTFPRNQLVPGRVPVFVDDDGVHCAVGHLLHRTGQDEIVQSIRASRNLALLPDLLDEPGLEAWLDAHGLEAAEAAWIQPAYCHMQQAGTGDLWIGCPPPVNESEAELTGRYLVASVGTSGIGGAMFAMNVLDLRRQQPSTGRAVVGMLAGAAGIGLGVAGIREGGDAGPVGWANLVVGAFGATSAAWTLRRASVPTGLAAGESERPITLRPWVPEGTGEAGAGGFGLQVRIGR